MRTMNRRATRDHLRRGTNTDLADGVGGTITGGPMAQIDLMEILTRGARGAGAVSGAAHVVVSSLDHSRGRDHGFALSDGSRIAFASIADAGLLKHDDDHALASDKPGTRARLVSRVPAGQRSGILTSA